MENRRLSKCVAGLLSALFLFSISASAEEDQSLDVVKEYERLALDWVKTFGTPAEKAADARMSEQRLKVVAQGPKAIKHLVPMLEHKQVNVRRGTAIALSLIVENHKVQDRKLLDTVLRRMIEEEDIKARSNLYHVANGLIDNQTKPSSDPEP